MPTIDEAIADVNAAVASLSTDLGVLLNDEKIRRQNAANAISDANSLIQTLKNQAGADSGTISQLQQTITDLQNNSTSQESVNRLTAMKDAISQIDLSITAADSELTTGGSKVPAGEVTVSNNDAASEGGSPTTDSGTGNSTVSEDISNPVGQEPVSTEDGS